MTLSTNVYVLDEVDVHEMFRFCQGLLTRYDEGRNMPPEQQRFTDEGSTTYTDGEDQTGVRRIANRLGQNLPGILDITYRDGAPLRTVDPGHNEWCEEDCDGEHARICYADVDFDTAYGAKFSFGGCSALHALLVSNLGQWLDGKGVRWEWRNEYTGEVFGGGERYTSLTTLLDSGVKAMAWFNDVVLPAIPAIAEDVARKESS